jgi:hypothetical protein
MNRLFTQAETKLDWALRVATQYGYFSKSEAKDYIYDYCRRKDGKTSYHFTHVDSGKSLMVHNRWHNDKA